MLAGWFVLDSWPVLRAPPMQGIHSQIESLANQIPERALVLTDESAPSHLAMTLTYAFDRLSLIVPRLTDSSAAVRRLIDRAMVDGRPVYVVTTARPDGGGLSLRLSDLEGFTARPVGSQGVGLPYRREHAWDVAAFGSARAGVRRALPGAPRRGSG